MSNLYVCNLCGYEDEYESESKTLECPFCRDGELELVSKEEVLKIRKEAGLNNE